MRKLIIILAVASIAAAPASPVTTLAGRYSLTFPDPFTNKPVRSVVVVLPIDARHAYIDFNLQFANGFSCGLSGVARAKDQSLIYRASRPDNDTGKTCILTIHRDGRYFAYDDDKGGCQHLCGANGEFTGVLDWSSRRAIQDGARIRRSSIYRNVFADWRQDGGR